MHSVFIMFSYKVEWLIFISPIIRMNYTWKRDFISSKKVMDDWSDVFCKSTDWDG
jgi:hypothetical protein